MRAVRTQRGNRLTQARWSNREYAWQGMQYLQLLTDPAVMDRLKLSSKYSGQDRAEQLQDAEDFYLLVLEAVIIEFWMLGLHSELPPGMWYGILDEDEELSKESHKRVKFHCTVMQRVVELSHDSSRADQQVFFADHNPQSFATFEI